MLSQVRELKQLGQIKLITPLEMESIIQGGNTDDEHFNVVYTLGITLENLNYNTDGRWQGGTVVSIAASQQEGIESCFSGLNLHVLSVWTQFCTLGSLETPNWHSP